MDSPADAAEIADSFGLAGHDLEGRFRVERVVAEGGFGIVYAARHPSLDAPVALQVLKLGDPVDVAIVDGFRREAQTVARLRHPAIVQVLDCGVGGRPARCGA